MLMVIAVISCRRRIKHLIAARAARRATANARKQRDAEIHARKQEADVKRRQAAKMRLGTARRLRPAPRMSGEGLSQAPHLQSSSILFSFKDLAKATRNFSDKLGSGGFGSVYRGFLIESHTEIAVKKLERNGELADLSLLEVEREVAVLAKVHHVNIVPLLGWCIDGPAPCLVYALMVEGALEERLACRNDRKPLGARYRILIISDVARGLAHLHDHFRVVHRDVKTANILLDRGLVAKIGDFGISRALAPQPTHSNKTTTVNMTTAIPGTFNYMSPEYVKGGEVSFKVDAYAFGIVMLETLTGLPVEHGGKNISLQFEDEMDTPEKLEQLLDKKAGVWQIEKVHVEKYHEVIAWCLEYRRQKRAEVAQIVGALENIREHTERGWQPRLQDCQICLEKFEAGNGVVCGGAEPSPICAECLKGYVEDETSHGNLPRLQGRGGIKCPGPKCNFLFSDHELARILDESTYATYQSAKRQMLAAELDRKFQKQLEKERIKWISLSGDEQKLLAMRRHIEERILTMHCPHCYAAWSDLVDGELGVQGCLAVACSCCNLHFCAYCLKKCSDSQSAHQHVQQCQLNISTSSQSDHGYFPQDAKRALARAHTKLRPQMLREYLNGLKAEEQPLRDRVLELVAPQLKENGIQVDQFKSRQVQQKV